jgi:hypothetical protein
MEENVVRLFNKDKSIKYHNEFYFEEFEDDDEDTRLRKFPLINRKFKCIGVKCLPKTNPYKSFVTDVEDTILCLNTREKLYFHRKVLFNMTPVIDVDKNPDYRK